MATPFEMAKELILARGPIPVEVRGEVGSTLVTVRLTGQLADGSDVDVEVPLQDRIELGFWNRHYVVDIGTTSIVLRPDYNGLVIAERNF